MVRRRDVGEGGFDLGVDIGLAQDAGGYCFANLVLDTPAQFGFKNVRRRDQLVLVSQLAVEPFDELRRGHRVQFDAVSLEPILPGFAVGSDVVAFTNVVGNRLESFCRFHVLDFQPQAER